MVVWVVDKCYVNRMQEVVGHGHVCAITWLLLFTRNYVLMTQQNKLGVLTTEWLPWLQTS